MGLGFTSPASDFIEKHCKGWLSAVRGAIEIDETTKMPGRCIGDALLLETKLGDKRMDDRIDRLTWGKFKYDNQDEKRDAILLVPKGWDAADYNKTRIQTDSPETTSKSKSRPADYGYILRHSVPDSDGSEKITFHIGGFTQHGTKAAALFLASKWPMIHKVFLRKGWGSNGLILILSWDRPDDGTMPAEISIDQAIEFTPANQENGQKETSGVGEIRFSAWKDYYQRSFVRQEAVPSHAD